jgi:hypothetical protein
MFWRSSTLPTQGERNTNHGTMVTSSASKIGRALASCTLLLASLMIVSSSALAFTEIEIRDDRDGAGPSHIFHLHDNVVVVVDPLDGSISAYSDSQNTALKTAAMPAGFRPWRLVRQPTAIVIISEDQKSRIEVGRDESWWPGEFKALPHDAAKFRMPPVARTRSGLMFKPLQGDGALAVRPIGPYYLASMRELERTGDGRRYVLWKEYYLSEPPPDRLDDQRIKINVYVGRFEKNGALSGIAPLPIAVMSRVGFDYATILPDGTIALLASLISNGKAGSFKIYRLGFETPSKELIELQQARGKPRRWASPPPLSNLFPLIEPSDAKILTLGDERQPVSREAAAKSTTVLKPAELRKRMDAYRDHAWTLTEENLRNPCEAEIVPGIPIACTRRTRFVLPPDETRERAPVVKTGLPYDWGGSDTIERFDEKIKQGYIAGNIGGTFWSTNVRRVTAGVDCSGLVSNVWQLGRHVGTTELADITRRVEALDRMRTGDVLLLPEHHSALYRQQEKPDGASLAIRVTEASSRCGAVCDSLYEIDHFQDFALRRLTTEP